MSIIAPHKFFTQVVRAYELLSQRKMESDIVLLDPPSSSERDSPDCDDKSGHTKRRNNLFGRADLAETYRTAKDLII